MKKKTIIILSVVIGVIAVFLFLYWIVFPRWMMYKATDYLSAIDNEPAKYYEHYSVQPNFEYITVDNGLFSAIIPSDFIARDRKEEYLPLIYRSSDEKQYEYVMFTNIVGEPMDLTDPEQYEDMDNVTADMGMKQLTRGFEKIGHGLPNSSYNTYKATALLMRDDYSFWDLEKAVAFSILGIFKEIAYYDVDTLYIYETDDMCGIIQINRYIDEETDFDGYRVIFEMYNADDLNTSYTLMLGMQSLEDIYAVINSVKIMK